MRSHPQLRIWLLLLNGELVRRGGCREFSCCRFVSNLACNSYQRKILPPSSWLDLTPFVAIDSCKGLAIMFQAKVEIVPHCKRINGICISFAAGLLIDIIWLYLPLPEALKSLQSLYGNVGNEFNSTTYSLKCWRFHRSQPYKQR